MQIMEIIHAVEAKNNHQVTLFGHGNNFMP